MHDQALPMLFPYAPEQFWEQLRQLIREEVSAANNSVGNMYETPGMTHKPIYTRDEIVALFGISKPTIYAWTRHGKLKPVKIRSRVYFLHSDIEQLLTSYGAR
jgi:excisionase family DNA binding protein